MTSILCVFLGIVQKNDIRKPATMCRLKEVYHFTETSLSLAKLPAGIALFRLGWYHKVKPALQNI